MIPLLVSDPLGDSNGLAYQYPRAALYREAGFADLTQFESVEKDGMLLFRIKLGAYPNPKQAPNGFGLATLVVYVNTEPGGIEELPGAGLNTPAGKGWDKAVLLTGWDAYQISTDGTREKITSRLENDQLEVDTLIPQGNYGYYVAVGIYDAFTSWNFRQTRTGGGTWWIDAPTGSPGAVDVLSDAQSSAYYSKTLEPVKAVTDKTKWAIASAGLGVLMILLAFVFPKRR